MITVVCTSDKNQNRVNWIESINHNINENNRNGANLELTNSLNGLVKLNEVEHEITREKHENLLEAQQVTNRELQSLSNQMQKQQITLNNVGKKTPEIEKNSTTNYAQDKRIQELEIRENTYAQKKDVEQKLHELSLEQQNIMAQSKLTNIANDRNFSTLNNINATQDRKIDALEKRTNKYEELQKNSIEKLGKEIHNNKTTIQKNNQDLQEQIHAVQVKAMELQNTRDTTLNDRILTTQRAVKQDLQNNFENSYGKRITTLENSIRDGQNKLYEALIRLRSQENTLSRSIAKIDDAENENIARLNSLEAKFDKKLEKTQENNLITQAYEKNIDAIRKDLSDSQQQIIDVKIIVDILKENIENTTELERIQNQLADNTNRILQQQQMNTKINDLATKLQELDKKLDENLRELEINMGAQLPNLVTKFEELDEKLGKLDENLRKLEMNMNTQLPNLDTQLKLLKEKITQDELTNKTQNEQIKKNEKAIDGKQDKYHSYCVA